MARALTNDELTLLRTDGQWSKLYLAVFQPNTVYSARLASVPASTDNVYEVTFNSGSGTLGDVTAGMTLYVGTSAGAYDLGMCRIRKAPIAGTFYIGLTSEIDWQSNCYLTVVDEFDLWAKHPTVSSGVLSMDVEVAYSDQHSAFSPAPVMGPHAVVWLDDATVDVNFSAADSWVIGSTITGYAWSAPGASASSGMTTATPTITYNAAGMYRVFCAVTAANGKSTTGVRHVFVYNRGANMPATVFQLAQCVGDYETGGWMFDLTMQDQASLSEIRDRTLVVLFAEDWYGATKQSIGPVTNRENIVCMGRVAGESLRWERETGLVHFTVHGFQHWLKKVKTFPVELTFASTAASWAEMPALTIERALFHLLYWHTTTIETMDVYLPDDGRYAVEARTIATTVWGQLEDLGFSKIMASPGVNRWGQLHVEIEPQMTPEASRTWATVMTITEADWQEAIDFSRVTVNEVAVISLNAQEVSGAGASLARYSLSPGHTPRRYGEGEMVDRVLCTNQSQANQLAGLMLGWRLNPYPEMPVRFAGNQRMIDLFPRQFCSITVATDDTPRGATYAGNLIPRRMTILFDGDAGYLRSEVVFEGETFEQIAIDGDVPESEDVDFSLPPPSLPEIPLPILPPLPPILIPGLPGDPTDGGPKKVLVHDSTAGLLLSENFNTSSPSWRAVNAGLTEARYQNIERILICPNGAVWVADTKGNNGTAAFIARAPYIGGTFVIIEDQSSINATLGTTGQDGRVSLLVCNPYLSEYVVYMVNASESCKIFRGNYGSITGWDDFSQGGIQNLADLSYGAGKWRLTYGFNDPYLKVFDSLLTAVESTTAQGFIPASTSAHHVPISTTDRLIHYDSSGGTISLSFGNGNSIVESIGSNYNLPTYVEDSEALFAIDPTGSLICATRSSTGKGKSGDGGYTFSDISNLPYTGDNWKFAWAGGSGNASRWVAVGSYVYYTDDFWISSPIDKRGSIAQLAPILSLTNVRVLEF